MSKLTIDWPDAGAERVRAALGRLLAAGPALRARAFEDRLEAVSAVLRDWIAPDSPWRRSLASELADATPFTLGTIEEGLGAALRAWRVEDFERCARAELASVPGRTLAPFEWTAILPGGSIPMPTLLSGLLPLVLGSPVLMRETAADPVTGRLLARSLAARDPSLGRAFESIDLATEDEAAFATLLQAPCVVATGSDETIVAVRDRLTPAQRFVGYGHRLSVAILGPEGGEAELARAARGLALDVARWDQAGCLSPRVAYVIGSADASGRAAAFGAETARALAALADEMPRGRLDPEQRLAIAHERAAAQMRNDTAAGMLFEAEGHTVVVDEDARPRPTPVGRFLRVQPVDSWEALFRVLEPFARHLSSVALAGVGELSTIDNGSVTGTPQIRAGSSTPRESVQRDLVRLGVSRVSVPGALQTPAIDWPHDGLPLFGPLARHSTVSFGL